MESKQLMNEQPTLITVTLEIENISLFHKKIFSKTYSKRIVNMPRNKNRLTSEEIDAHTVKKILKWLKKEKPLIKRSF